MRLRSIGESIKDRLQMSQLFLERLEPRKFLADFRYPSSGCNDLFPRH